MALIDFSELTEEQKKALTKALIQHAQPTPFFQFIRPMHRQADRDTHISWPKEPDAQDDEFS